jgi:general secretion pathway protein G
MRKAFTMIEIIFVIVIIGILAAVAIPKLAANRDDAVASICAHEVGQLIHEIGNTYTEAGYVKFKDLTIHDMSRVLTNVGTIKNGIFEGDNTKIDTIGVTYYCGGEAVVKLVGILDGTEYNLTVEDKNPTNPTALQAEKKLIDQNILIASSVRHYKL